jgi:hypothetical protein
MKDIPPFKIDKWSMFAEKGYAHKYDTQLTIKQLSSME